LVVVVFRPACFAIQMAPAGKWRSASRRPL